MGCICSSNPDLSSRTNFQKMLDETNNYHKDAQKTDGSLQLFTRECERYIHHLETYNFTQSQAFVKEGLDFGLTNETDIPNGGIQTKSAKKSATSNKLLIGKFARRNATFIIQYWNRTLSIQSLPTDIIILLSQFFAIENPCNFAFQQVFPMTYLLHEMESLKDEVKQWFSDGQFRSQLDITPIEIYRNDIQVSIGELITFFERYYKLDQLIMTNRRFLQEIFFYIKRYYAGKGRIKYNEMKILMVDMNGNTVNQFNECGDFMQFITNIFMFMSDTMSKSCFVMMILNSNQWNRQSNEEMPEMEFMLSFVINSCLYLLKSNDVKNKQFNDEIKMDEKQALKLATAMVTGLIIYDCYFDVFSETNKRIRSIECVKMIVNDFERIYSQQCSIEKRSVMISKLNELACAIKYGCRLSEKAKGLLQMF
eukprot:322137_1